MSNDSNVAGCDTKSVGGPSSAAKGFNPCDLVANIDARDFDWVMRRFREFFAKKGLIESYAQGRLEILRYELTPHYLFASPD